MGTTEPRLRVAVVTLGDPECLHALAEPFNKTLRDRGLGGASASTAASCASRGWAASGA